MNILKYPIVSITFFLALGIAANHYLQLPQLTVYSLLAVATASVAFAYFKSGKHLIQKPYFAFSAWGFAFCLGMLAQWLHFAPNQPKHYTHNLNKGNYAVIKGVVSERLKPNLYSEKYFLTISGINEREASGKILITVPIDSTHNRLYAGDELIIADYLKPIGGALNPYQFDYASYMATQNVFHQVKLKENYFKTGRQKTFGYYIESIRNTLINSFEIHHYSPQTLNVIKALLLGQRQDMDPETTANYTNAGVVHILAISGLHIAVLFYIITLILRPLNRFKQKGKLAQLLLVLVFLWLFAFISGMSASVVRSVVMFSFVSIGMYFNRNANTFNSVALSMLLLLLAKPMFLFDVGFQLSYAAVFAIVVLQPFYRHLKVSKYKGINYVTDTLVISFVAQIGVLPLSLYYFNQFPLLFLLANVVIVPLSTGAYYGRYSYGAQFYLGRCRYCSRKTACPANYLHE